MFELLFNNLIKNSLIYGLGQILNRFLSFFLLPVFTAYLTPADFGVLAILGVMNLVVTACFSYGSGAATGLCYFEGNDHRRKEETIWTSVLILLVSAVVIGLFAFCFPSCLSRLLFGEPYQSKLVTLSLLSAGASILNAQFLLYLMFEKRAFTYVIFTTTLTMLSLGLTVLTVVFWGRGVEGMIESILTANVAALGMLVFVCARSLSFRLSGSVARDFMRFGAPLIPSSFFLFVIQHANQYFLQRFRGIEEVGVYIIGFNFGLVMNLLVSAFSSAWYPHFMSFVGRQNEAKDHFGRVVTAYTLGFGVLSLLFYVGARPVVMIMTQPAFYDAYKIIGPASTAYFFSGFFFLLLPAVYFAKEVKYVSLIQGGCALCVVVLDLLLIPWVGMVGAVSSLVAGYVLLVSLQFAWNRSRKGKYFQFSCEWRRLRQFAFVYVCTAGLSFLPRNLTILPEVAFSGSIFVCLLLILYLSLSGGERRFLFSLIR